MAFTYSSSTNTMHTITLKVMYIHHDLLHVSAKHLAILREVKYKASVKKNITTEFLKYQNEFTDTK
jgi:hypothetical protein